LHIYTFNRPKNRPKGIQTFRCTSTIFNRPKNRPTFYKDFVAHLHFLTDQ